MGIILKREDLIVESQPGKYFDTERLENDIKEISNKDAEGRIKVLYKMRPIIIFKPTRVGPSGKPEDIFIEGEPPYIKIQDIHVDDAHDYYISNVDGINPLCLSEYIVKYRQYHYRFYDHTRENPVLLKPGDMIKLTAHDNYRELHNVGCIVGLCSTDTIMLAVADPKLIRATNSRRYDGDVVTKIVLKADIMGDENAVKEFQIEKIE